MRLDHDSSTRWPALRIPPLWERSDVPRQGVGPRRPTPACLRYTVGHPPQLHQSRNSRRDPRQRQLRALKRRRGRVRPAAPSHPGSPGDRTLQLEFKYLSHLTGNPVYWKKVERVRRRASRSNRADPTTGHRHHPRTRVTAWTRPHLPLVRCSIVRSSRLTLVALIRACSLLRTSVSARAATATTVRRTAVLLTPADPSAEYLLKQYLQTNRTEPVYLAMHDQAMAGVKSQLLRTSIGPKKLMYTVELLPRRTQSGHSLLVVPKVTRASLELG